MTRAKEIYDLWLQDPTLDKAALDELSSISADNQEIEERFYKDLEFGTAGLRGIIGIGTNRMNKYIVARATAGMARYLLDLDLSSAAKGLVIAYDSRHFSAEFARCSALVLAGFGIKSYLFDSLRPVPVLSYAIRYLQAAGGIMITASHNPAQYNGFKAYGPDGGQLAPEAASLVSRWMDKFTLPADVLIPGAADVENLMVEIGADIDSAYTEMLLGLSLNRSCVQRQHDMKIVYTPLHGTGNIPVRRILDRTGFTRVLVVPEQEEPNGEFPTVKSPNPEEKAALHLAIELARKEDAELVMATDPDADRTGMAVRADDGTYKVLTGNQIGLLLMDYILDSHRSAGTMPPNPFVVSTIVSTKLTRRIAAAFQVKLYETLTGFKFIAELIKEHDEQGDQSFLFGFEESFGFLAGTEVRDKDAVVTCMLIAEMAAAAADKGQTLYDRLQELYSRYGCAAELTVAITLEGKTGLEKIAAAMSRLHSEQEKLFADIQVEAVDDYLRGERRNIIDNQTRSLNLPVSDVILFETGGLDWFCVRPSGTEPKLKLYYGIYRDTQQAAENDLHLLKEKVESAIRRLL